MRGETQPAFDKQQWNAYCKALRCDKCGKYIGPRYTKPGSYINQNQIRHNKICEGKK